MRLVLTKKKKVSLKISLCVALDCNKLIILKMLKKINSYIYMYIYIFKYIEGREYGTSNINKDTPNATSKCHR